MMKMIRYLAFALIFIGGAVYCIGKAIEEYGKEQAKKHEAMACYR